MSDQNTKPINTIGVFTSGGDAPGMNPCIRSVVRTALSHNLNVIGIMDGYEGLIHGKFKPLGPRDVSGILQRGGTVLRTARSKEFKTKRGRSEAIRQMNIANIDALVAIGGDGSLTGAHILANEHNIPIVGIPASIDNDIVGTDTCIGVDTALNTILEAIDKLRDTASSHSRAFLIETMGRNCGYLALMAGINSGAEMVLIPEVSQSVEEIIQVVDQAYKRGKEHCIIVVAEGFETQTTNLARLIEEKELGFTTRVTILGHLQRGGAPLAYDRWIASRFGFHAVEFLLQGLSDVMVCLQGREITHIPLTEIINNTKPIPKTYYEISKILAR